jgi:DNA-directed RNA polymerase subunit RPC12/RpoP
MTCPKCQGATVRAGLHHGKQRLQCRVCGFRFLPESQNKPVILSPCCNAKSYRAGRCKDGKDKSLQYECTECGKRWRTVYCELPEKRRLIEKLKKSNDIKKLYQRYRIKYRDMTLAEFIDYIEFATDHRVIDGRLA